jgi:multisubunit Na+/H+ antiporter MnhF subunit
VKRIRDWWSVNFLAAELVAAAVGALVFGLWVWSLGGDSTVNDVLRGNRADLYGVLASIFGALLGFVITTLSIVLGFSTSDRLVIVRDSKHYATLWKVFTASIRALGLATAVAVASLVIDRENHPVSFALVICAFTTLLATARIARSVWILERVVGLVTAPSKARLGSTR